MSEKPALHQSSLTMLYRCPQQYKWRYVQGKVIPPGAFMVAGHAVHDAVRQDLGSKVTGGALLPDDAIEDVAADALRLAWEGGVLLTDDEKARGEANVRAEMLDRSVRLARLHHGELAPQITPTALERSWRLTIEGYPYDLAGRYDIEESDGLRDTKTASKSPGAGTADTSLQLTTYAVARRFTTGILPERLSLDYLVDLKKPKALTLATRRDADDVEVFLRRLELAMRQLEGGIFPPCDPSAWWCSPRWCGYYGICRYVKGAASVPVPSQEE